ncbi:hypothetical protein D3C85_1490140 [compost metagenome]
MDEVEVPMVNEEHRPLATRRHRHSSLLLFQAAQRIRVRTPKPRKGSGGLSEGMPVTAWISLSSEDSAPTTLSASSVPEMVPQAAPTPLSHAVANTPSSSWPKKLVKFREMA